MTTTGGGGGWQPTPLQGLLLDAAFAPRERAEASFAAWDAATGFDEIDDGSFRLLPLVAHHLAELGVTTARGELLGGIQRRSWFENQMVLSASLPAVDALLDAGIDVVVFKGAALSALAYDNMASRPMDDIDILVREHEAERALSVFLDAGWEPGDVRLPRPTGSLPAEFRRFRHSAPLSTAAGHAIDLHWHATDSWCWPDADADLWASAREFDLRDRTVRALAVEDELIVACVHGVRWNPVPPVRWVADALTLLHTTIDWCAFVSHARRLRVEPQLALTMRLLHDRFDAAIPVGVLDALCARSPGYFERSWLDSRLRRSDRRTLAAHYGRYERSIVPGDGPRTWLSDLPAHLAYLFGCDSSRDLPAELWRRTATRVRRGWAPAIRVGGVEARP